MVCCINSLLNTWDILDTSYRGIQPLIQSGLHYRGPQPLYAGVWISSKGFGCWLQSLLGHPGCLKTGHATIQLFIFTCAVITLCCLHCVCVCVQYPFRTRTWHQIVHAFKMSQKSCEVKLYLVFSAVPKEIVKPQHTSKTEWNIFGTQKLVQKLWQTMEQTTLLVGHLILVRICYPPTFPLCSRGETSGLAALAVHFAWENLRGGPGRLLTTFNCETITYPIQPKGNSSSQPVGEGDIS